MHRLVFAVLKMMRLVLNVLPMEYGIKFKVSAVIKLTLNVKTALIKINGIRFLEFAAHKYMIRPHHLVHVLLEVITRRKIFVALMPMILKLKPVFAQLEITMKFKTPAANQLVAATALHLRSGTIS
jgi:hypothetical protein